MKEPARPHRRPPRKALGKNKNKKSFSSVEELLKYYIELFEHAPVGYIVIDNTGITHQANLISTYLLNVDRDEIIHHPFHVFVSAESQFAFNEFIKKIFKTKGREICKVALVRRDTAVSLSATLEAVATSDGKFCHIAILDDTVNENFEARLIDHAAVLANMSDAVISTDSKLHIRSWNHAAEIMYGWAEEEVLGLHIDQVCGTHFIGTSPVEAQAYLFIEGIWRGEVIQQRKDGTPFYAHTSVALLRDTSGLVIGGITINSDITERKQAEESLAASEAELRALFASIHDAVMVIDKQGVYRKIAPTNPSLLYKSSQEMIGKRIDELFDSERAKVFIEAIQTVLKTNQPMQIEYELFMNERQFWFETSISPMPNDHTLWVARDITERKRGEKELKETKILLEKTFASLDQAIFIVMGKTRKVIACNPAVQRIFGYLENEIIGRDTNFMYADRAEYEQYPQKLIPALDAHNVYQTEIQMQRKDGTIFPAEVTETGIMDENGVRTGVVSVVRDITERKHVEERLTYLSTHDGLTGLYNRSYFDETLARLERGRQYPISIVMADVDYMKKTNDTLGHAAGDTMLKNVAKVLSSAFRAEDIVARIGGDEFAILMPNTGTTEAKDALKRVRHNLHQHNNLQEGQPISLSLGARTTNKKMLLSELFKEADAEMYADKLGRDTEKNINLKRQA